MFKFIVRTLPVSVPTAAIKWWFFWEICIGVEVVEGVVKWHYFGKYAFTIN